MSLMQSSALALTERLCRPQRIGVFGRRSAGKTTLLAMLYREAVGGRLPNLRLAAADARTAAYLSDKIVQLEAGQPVPATLGETELRFHLYCQNQRIELLIKDYQGEHVALGRQESIRDFLRDCDAVWLCLDDDPTATPAERLTAQQEVEQLVEDYLAARPTEEPHRPMALVITKADQRGQPESGEPFDMVLHALDTHCPSPARFAVSSLGAPLMTQADTIHLSPNGLAGPLLWLVDALRAQDEARIEKLWQQHERSLTLLSRGVDCFTRRYPEAPAAVEFHKRLTLQRKQRSRRRRLAFAASAFTLFIGMTAYDAYGAQATQRFAAEHSDDPAAVRRNWERYQVWHPTRHLWRPAAARQEAATLADLDGVVAERRRAERLAELTRQAKDPDADAEAAWQSFQRYRADYPAQEADSTLREAIGGRRAAGRQREAQLALADLEHAEARADLSALIARADGFLREYGDAPAAAEVRRKREAYLHRLDERDVEAARTYSAAQPLNFHSRREHYRQYLDRHPTGAFTAEAQTAMTAIADAWDKHDFRAVRDHYLAQPGDLPELEARSRSYLAAHGEGRYRTHATELLRWAERVAQPHDYRVVLKSGQFDKKIAWTLSRGPDLSVEIEVNGVRYGPSSIVKNQYEPQWDYEFPRRVRWKLGDPVRIRVYDHDYYKRLVLDIVAEPNDAVALWMVSGGVCLGENTLVFESDFAMPVLPLVE